MCQIHVRQIEAMVEAARSDKIGKHAQGAMERVVNASQDALVKITAAGER